MKKTGVRATPRAEAFINQHFRTLAGGAELLVNSFPGLYEGTLDDIKGRFSQADLIAALSAFQDVKINREHPVAHMKEVIRAYRFDGDKYSKQSVAQKIHRGLKPFEQLCFCVWLLGFWERRDRTIQIVDYLKRLE